mgnify:CR=1 FL=1
MLFRSEVVSLHFSATRHLPVVSWSRNPLWFAALFVLIPLFRELHFYAVHRLIHHPLIYKRVHSLHHRNVNPSPYSGLSMHPLEHLAYFSGLLLHWIVPSHPVHIVFHATHAGLSPAPGHLGFHRIEIGRVRIPTDYYAHFLHHALFEVNYADGVFPLDKWFGTFHDGTPQADEATRARRLARRSPSTV